MALSYRWIKLYIEILDDPKMGLLPNHLWRRTIEFFLLAGERGKGGELGPVTEIAWRLRVSEADLLQSLRSMEEIGIVHCAENGHWVVTKFAERQAAEPPKERTEAYRKREYQRASNEPVTTRYTEEIREEENRGEERRGESAAAAACRLYEQEIGTLTKVISDKILLAVGEYPIDWFELAFREAASHNARNWSYVDAILRRWKTDGFQSKNGKGSKPGPAGKPVRAENAPEAFTTGEFSEWVER